MHSPSETEFHLTIQTPSCGEVPLNLYIPLSQKKFFTFDNDELYLNFPSIESDSKNKTPVMFIGSSTAEKGLYNQNFKTLPQSPRLIVCRDIEKDSYVRKCPEHIIIAISEKFDEFGIGSLKAMGQTVATYFHQQATNNQVDGEDLWPFIFLLEDTAVNFRKNDNDICFDEFLKNVEECLKIEQPAITGFSSQKSCMFSKGLILNLATLAEKNILFNYQKFFNEDEDFILRAKSLGFKTQKFEGLFIDYKVISQPLRNIAPTYNDNGDIIPIEKYFFE